MLIESVCRKPVLVLGRCASVAWGSGEWEREDGVSEWIGRAWRGGALGARTSAFDAQ